MPVTNPDLTVNDIISYVDQLPQAIVTAETALRNAMIPVYQALGATKNRDVCAKADSLAQSLFVLETQLNKLTQQFVDGVDVWKPFAILVGGYRIPGSGATVGELGKLLGIAQSLQSSVSSHSTGTLGTAKSYISQFVTAAHQVIALMPQLGSYAVEGFSVAQFLGGLSEVVALI